VFDLIIFWIYLFIFVTFTYWLVNDSFYWIRLTFWI